MPIYKFKLIKNIVNYSIVSFTVKVSKLWNLHLTNAPHFQYNDYRIDTPWAVIAIQNI